MSTAWDVAVIGAGGAGLLAGLAAAKAGAKTVLFERMKSPARKVAISGGGRCNFTNTLDARRFVKLFGDKHSKLLGRPLAAFSNQDIIDLLGKYGVTGEVERNYRLYTKSGRGMDVVEALVKEFQQAGGQLVTQARVSALHPNENGFQLEAYIGGSARPDVSSPRDAKGKPPPKDALGASHEVFQTKTVIVSTGGLSYPATGSSGDGYEWAKSLGHGITPLKAALVGLNIQEEWPRKIPGTALEDAQVELYVPGANKALATERAELLFTHFGVSGPCILDLSNAFVGHDCKTAQLRIDFFPNTPKDVLDQRLLDTFKHGPQRALLKALDGWLPARLLESLVNQLGEAAHVPVARLSRELRLKLLDALKSNRLTITGTRGIEYGEVTAGGIAWEDVDATTLESKKTPGLFFAGEILDLAGRCGGFNLQAAFSTGYFAGQHAAKKALQIV
jgi:predicted flavoprotein YhiN